MGDRIDALETQMGDVTSTLQALALQMQQHAEQMQQQSAILNELSKQIGKKAASADVEVSMGDSSQSESRLAGKKVKLPLFEGEDPVVGLGSPELRSISTFKTLRKIYV